MKIDNDAKALAMLYAYWALAETLLEQGAIDRKRFFTYAASGRAMLLKEGNPIAAEALENIIDPIASRFPPDGDGV